MNSTLLLIMIGVTLSLALCLVASLLVARTGRASAQRIFEVTRRQAPVQRNTEASQQMLKTLFALAHWLRARLGISETERLAEQFVQAGFKNSAQRDLYMAARVLCPLAAVGLGSFIASNRFFWMMTLGGIFYLAPSMVLQRLIKRRREKIRLGIPDTVDLLVICVDAGLGLDQAMLRVGRELVNSHPDIYEELLQINREQRAGKLRMDAWQAMANRCKLPEIDGFVNMLMQTERFGTPIARALSNFGDDIRLKRRQRAEELAAKTTVKIIFPLVLFIFPSIFVVLLGPAAINIMRGMGGS
jgi:tight adherence protein C